ncbi:MAG: 2,3-bisphosphoglycerate-independent phosphoglycerate mutase [Actinobacteria bacterium]|nr:2,3-bisphosphoglycerate-independent phosphoglycerate mutase [Actinomycetota bacterium]
MSEFPSDIILHNDHKIVFVVLDGLGGLPLSKDGKTEMETARTPNLDKLAAENICGCFDPLLPGITPGSGPAHLTLFGYDALKMPIGRGLLAALGIGFDVSPRDVCIRVNFCTLDANGQITDRRAGRISSEENQRLLKIVRQKLEPPKGVELFLETVSEHRALMVLRSDQLDDNVADTDPQALNVPPLPAKTHTGQSSKTTEIVNGLVKQIREILSGVDSPANFMLLRGFAKMRPIPSFEEKWGCKAGAVAGYPMYRGLARLVGMELVAGPTEPKKLAAAAAKHLPDFDFLFVHFKYTDKTGEDGDFQAKVAQIEAFDAAVPAFVALKASALVITADHSTPAKMAVHSWHPVPVLIASELARPDDVKSFSERAMVHGGLGRQLMRNLMPLVLAHAGRLTKFGA